MITSSDVNLSVIDIIFWREVTETKGSVVNLCGLFNAKAIHVKEQLWYYLTNSWGGIFSLELVRKWT